MWLYRATVLCFLEYSNDILLLVQENYWNITKESKTHKNFHTKLLEHHKREQDTQAFPNKTTGTSRTRNSHRPSTRRYMIHEKWVRRTWWWPGRSSSGLPCAPCPPYGAGAWAMRSPSTPCRLIHIHKRIWDTPPIEKLGASATMKYTLPITKPGPQHQRRSRWRQLVDDLMHSHTHDHFDIVYAFSDVVCKS
jgi:hypothetical protein